MMIMDIPIKDRFNVNVVILQRIISGQIQILFHLFRNLQSLIDHHDDISAYLITGFKCYLG